LTWQSEIEKWIAGEVSDRIDVIHTGKQEFARRSLITIISYELAAKRVEELANKNYRIIIADESHALKSRNTKRTKQLVPIIQKAEKAILLSGTPGKSADTREQKTTPKTNRSHPLTHNSTPARKDKSMHEKSQRQANYPNQSTNQSDFDGR